MNAFVIVFRIADGRRKAQVIALIRGLGSWMSYFDGVWLVRTNRDLHQLERNLVDLIAQTDSLLVVKAEPRQAGGYLPQEAWDWLHNA